MKLDNIESARNKDITILPPLSAKVQAARIPSWTQEGREHRGCPSCNADSPHPVVMRPDGFIIHQCLPCGMIYLADVPGKDEVDEFYRQYSSFKRYKSSNTLLAWFEIQRELRRNKYLSILEATGGIKGMTVCEVGCSHGNFLELIKHKQGRVVGVEPDADARISLSRRNIPFLEQIGLHEEFDVICLFQVLEHLVDPSVLLTDISRSLSKDGRVLIAVPNGGEYAKTGPTWLGFRVDLEHVNYFDLKSLAALLSKHGLFCEHYWEDAQPAIARETYQRREVAGIRWPKRIVKALFNRFMVERGILNRGSFVLTVLARKG